VTQSSTTPIPPTCARRSLGGSRTRRCGFILALLVAIVPGASLASESGVSTYHNGLVDLLAGFMAPPGTLIFKNYFIYWNASGRFVTQDGKFAADNDVKVYAHIVQAAYVTVVRFSGLTSALAFSFHSPSLPGAEIWDLLTRRPFREKIPPWGESGTCL